MLTKEEQAWAEKNMREDFTIGFSERIQFTDNSKTNITGSIPLDEAESDGYFCENCGKTSIDDLEEHVRECMKEEK